VDRLAERWKISRYTVRIWAARGHFGKVHRISLNRVAVSSVAVRQFEERYAAVLGVGEIALTIVQCAKRYGVHTRTLYKWREFYRFPEPEHIPGSTINRWRISRLEAWDRALGVTPPRAIPQELEGSAC